MNNTQKKQKVEGLSFYTLLHDLVYILAAITFVFVFAVRLVGVEGSSMYPTLVGASESIGTHGDYLALMSNFVCDEYEQGDIVVACLPDFDDGKPIVKRIIATEGQTVEVRTIDGVDRVLVDGELLDEPYIREDMNKREELMVVVPEHCYFVMGDNRNNSLDSRILGTIDQRYIVGRALLVVFPGQDGYNGSSRNWSRFGAVS